MTITYYDNRLVFGTDFGPNLQVCDDSDLGRCFDLLCDGNDVYVRNNHGFRRFTNYLMQRYQYVKAAGGRVEAPDGSCLLIHREGKWDLPKGMVEPGESLAAAALREVQEETGLPQAAIDHLLAKSYHIYDKYGGWHLKQTSWYAMRAPEKYPLTPQAEEGISEARWAAAGQWRELLRNSFASLRQLADIQ